MKAALIHLLTQNPIATRLREFGPYFLLELVMPGGSVLALLLWWHRHRHEDGHRRVLIRNERGNPV
jgi:hypothetical protein